MKKILKKAISVLLVAVMVFGASPLSGFVGLELPEFVGFTAKAETITSGTCGENLIWTFDESTGTLTIDGIGRMMDFAFFESSHQFEKPWSSLNIRVIIFGDSVTSIGNEAFLNFSSLERVLISESIQYIGFSAFKNCTNLANISALDSVIDIGGNAFYNTKYYKNESNWENDALYIGNHLINTKSDISGSYTVKSGTKTIADYAFSCCASLTNVIIPDSVIRIGHSAFQSCDSLENITVKNNEISIGGNAFHNTKYYKDESNWENNALYIGNHLINIKSDMSGSYTVKSGTKTIADYAFSDRAGFDHCYNLENIIIPNGVTRIGSKAFYNCSSLLSITIPNTVKFIGEYIFSCCFNITDIYYAGTEEQWNTLSISTDNECLTNATVHYNYFSEGGEILPPVENDYSTQNIKVMSYNVYSYNSKGYKYQDYSDNKDYTYAARTKYIINNIVDNMPDSVGFQEITEEFKVSISTSQDITGRALDDYAWATKEYRNDGTKSETNEGCLILYNAEKYDLLEEDTFWLNENGEKYEKADEWNAGYTRVCSYAVLKDKQTGFIYAHFNTHIDHNAPAAINSVNMILDFIDENFADMPVILTGDLNHKNDTDVYDAIINNGFADVNTAYDTTLTYHEYNRGQYQPKIIDYIFVNKYLSASSYDVYDRNYSSDGLEIKYASDHHPIVAELTSVDLTDSDGDGLPDNWEINGVDADNDGAIDINLKEMGADPYKPDIFVEIDWMEGYKPSYEALKMVYESFRDSPDGGINLHIDAGPNSIDYVTGKSWSEYSIKSDGEEVEYKKNITIGDTAEERSDWYNIVDSNFSKERRGVFRHCLYIRQYNNSTSTGIASGIVGQYYIVAKGQFSTDIWEAGTFMHELGHTLGLRHGGCDDLNYKANYLSVMNYLYQGGLVYSGEEDYKLDYSRYELPSYNEASLDETKGVDPNGMTADTGLGIILKTSKFTPIYNVAYKAIDFNLDGDTDDVKLTKDLNGDALRKDENGNFYAEYDVHNSYNDWENLIYTGGTIGGNGTELLEIDVCSSDDVIEEINSEEMELISSVFVKSTIRAPSITTISYGDAIVLHADITGTIPEGAYIEWTSSNGNFDFDVLADGTTCRITPEKSGNTTFIATIYDAEGNAISTDEQVMTSKAGFFQKIIAFFKKLFGLTKTIPQIYNGIF